MVIWCHPTLNDYSPDGIILDKVRTKVQSTFILYRIISKSISYDHPPVHTVCHRHIIDTNARTQSKIHIRFHTAIQTPLFTCTPAPSLRWTNRSIYPSFRSFFLPSILPSFHPSFLPAILPSIRPVLCEQGTLIRIKTHPSSKLLLLLKSLSFLYIQIYIKC